MDEDLWIPLVFFFSVTAIFIVWLYLRFRARQETQNTLRLALEKGAELSPELISQLSEPEPSQERDLRRGLVWTALGVGLAIFGVVLGEPDAMQPILGSAAFPLTIGIAFLAMWRFGSKRDG